MISSIKFIICFILATFYWIRYCRDKLVFQKLFYIGFILLGLSFVGMAIDDYFNWHPRNLKAVITFVIQLSIGIFGIYILVKAIIVRKKFKSKVRSK